MCREVGSRTDIRHAMARATDPVSLAIVVAYKDMAIPRGALAAGDTALAEINEAVEVADRSSDDFAVVLVRIAQGTRWRTTALQTVSADSMPWPGSAICASRSAAH